MTVRERPFEYRIPLALLVQEFRDPPRGPIAAMVEYLRRHANADSARRRVRRSSVEVPHEPRVYGGETGQLPPPGARPQWIWPRHLKAYAEVRPAVEWVQGSLHRADIGRSSCRSSIGVGKTAKIPRSTSSRIQARLVRRCGFTGRWTERRAALKQALRFPAGAIQQISAERRERAERVFRAAAEGNTARLRPVVRRHRHRTNAKPVHAGLDEELLIEDEIVGTRLEVECFEHAPVVRTIAGVISGRFRPSTTFSIIVRNRFAMYLIGGMPPASTSSRRLIREPSTISTTPALMKPAMYGTSAPSYWLSGCSMTTISASRLERQL